MRTHNKAGLLLIITLLCLMPFAAQAERSVTFGDYTLHYNVITTDNLQPEVAKAYEISRSKNRAMLNIVILKNVMGTPGQPVTGKLTGTAKNLSNQMRTLAMREIKEANAIYYISEFRVSNNEVLNFDIDVLPVGEKQAYTLKFKQQFFTN